MGERFHLFIAFGAKDSGHVVCIHDRFARQIDVEDALAMDAAGFVVTIKPLAVFAFLLIRRQLFHGFAASGAEDGGQVVSVHHRLLGQFENRGPIARTGASFTVAVEFC